MPVFYLQIRACAHTHVYVYIVLFQFFSVFCIISFFFSSVNLNIYCPWVLHRFTNNLLQQFVSRTGQRRECLYRFLMILMNQMSNNLSRQKYRNGNKGVFAYYIDIVSFVLAIRQEISNLQWAVIMLKITSLWQSLMQIFSQDQISWRKLFLILR